MKLSLFYLVLSLAAPASLAHGAGMPSIRYERESAPRAGEVAEYNGKAIRLEDLEKKSAEIFSAKAALYKAQKEALDAHLRDLILEEIAAKEKISLDALLTREMAKARKNISNADVEAYLKSRNVPNPAKTSKEIKDNVRGLLQVQGLVAEATKKNGVKLYLERPRSTPLDVALAGQPAWGDEKAPITIVEYTDFQCEYCNKARSRITELKKLYGKKLRIVYKSFPLGIHANARPAAEAGMCVHEQGTEKFWAFYDLVFDNQKSWKKEDFVALAKKAGAEEKRFVDCLEGKKYSQKIDENIAEATKIGVTSTPSYLVNNQLIKGARPLAEFRELIED
jgi:protein-disulfide isomerase